MARGCLRLFGTGIAGEGSFVRSVPGHRNRDEAETDRQHPLASIPHHFRVDGHMAASRVALDDSYLPRRSNSLYKTLLLRSPAKMGLGEAPSGMAGRPEDRGK